MLAHLGLVERVRQLLHRKQRISEKRMFGGLAFLLNNNICCCVHKEELIVRFSPNETDKHLIQPHTRIFDLPGRPMRGWIFVSPQGLVDNKELTKWIQIAVKFAKSLPVK